MVRLDLQERLQACRALGGQRHEGLLGGTQTVGVALIAFPFWERNSPLGFLGSLISA